MSHRLTVFGCDPEEAAAFARLAPEHGFLPVTTDAEVAEHTAHLARGSSCVSVSHKSPVEASTLRALHRAGVRHLSTRSVGHDHVDLACAAELGIEVGTTAYSPDSVADYTLMLILMALRDARSVIGRADRHDYRLGRVRGRELRDLTVGVVGTGRIGTAVLDRLRGFGCRVLCHDLRPRGAAGAVSLEELLRSSDVVTLHVPLDSATRHLLDRRRIAAMRPGAIVVNTGRGGLVDTEALVEALEAGHLGGAALDVVEGESGIFYADCRDRPIPDGALVRLQRLPNVLVSPHTAYYTDHALRDTVEHTLRSCANFESKDVHV